MKANETQTWAKLLENVTDVVSAHKVAAILVPDENSPYRFVRDAVREILSGVLFSLANTSRMPCTQQEVIRVMESEQQLREVLGRTPLSRALIVRYVDSREWQSIRAGLACELARLRSTLDLPSGVRQHD